MSTNTQKSPLMILIIIAVVLFIFAILWNQFKSDNSEEITVETVKPYIKEIKNVDYREKYPELDPNNDIEDENSQISSEEYKNIVQQKMSMAFTLNSPEKIIKSIKKNKEEGNLEIVDNLIKYLLEAYPEYELPADF